MKLITTDDKITLLEQHIRALDDVSCVARAAESPIERLFGLALISVGWRTSQNDSLLGDEWDLLVKPHLDLSGGSADLLCVMVTFYGGAAVIMQAPVRCGDKSYRVDFAFFLGATRVIVELDGHDFHERTKDQASRDKRRDRDLSAAGWTVLRFTGSEVWRDARQCAWDVQGTIARLSGRWDGTIQWSPTTELSRRL